MNYYLKRKAELTVFLIVFLIFNGSASASTVSVYKEVKCIIHIHTDISSGTRTLESYVREAKKKEIDAIVITDDDWRRWEYGLPPLRRLIKKVVKKESVMTFGMEKYLTSIRQLNEKYKDVVIIDGVQTNPFYYWSGNFLKGTLTLNNRNKDMLVIGMDSAKDYKNMPLTVNYKSSFDAYHGDQFTRPYQELIDYVVERNGLILWSHPEYEENSLQDGIRLLTVPYHGDLIGTHNYTGFAIFWEGYKKIGTPRGVWDRVLTEYCQGRRTAPVWAFGEIEEDGAAIFNLDDIANIVYVKKVNRQQIVDALKKGRFYVSLKLFDREPLVLEEFTVHNESNTKAAIMGEEVSFSGDPIVKIRIAHKKNTNKKITVKLIRNNKVIEELNGQSLIDIEYKDEGLEKNKKYYYRIDVIDDTAVQLISNPLFFMKR